MRIRGRTFFLGILLACCLTGSGLHAQNESTTIDTTIPLEQRIVETPASVLRPIRAHLEPHTLSVAERDKVIKALAALPAFETNALAAHVRSISFVEGRVTNGMTIPLATPSGTIYDIVIHASVLDETVSAFFTRKEQGCYRASTSGETIAIEAGSQDAVLYVLLHEAMHVVDGIPPVQSTAAYTTPRSLAADIWNDSLTVNPPYRSPFLEGACFRTGTPGSMDNAQDTYKALQSSPFASLYGSKNWYDDSAELVALYHLTQVLHEPYRITLRTQEQTILSIEPMSSPTVQRRFSAVKALYQQKS
ncbi:hypothetical protein [Terriglobus roseus]|uniref:Secreted protein n=1 Tax=Terriglobus roseus TaxID=392734 RepID=A0A1G7Q0L0_9BACT|nr:hypothetical protein [Terriglobus roseus]SDF91170.1 hypothetical protein SAMN05444167_3670 [Terriglobus roseus]